jgi:hypothetical protein
MYSRCIRLFNQLSKFCMKTEANISYLWNVHLMSTFVLCNLQMMSARYHILQKYPNWKTPKQKKKYAWPWRKRTGPLYLFCCRRTQFNLIELNLIEVDGSLWLMTHVWSRSYDGWITVVWDISQRTLSTFTVRGNRSTRRKSTTFW